MIDRLLLCTDLDRTLIPNGTQPESASARTVFKQLASQPELTLAYVTGRHKGIVEDAITLYSLPVPDFVIADVGTTIYRVENGDWLRLQQWDRQIESDWNSHSNEDLKALFKDIRALRIQERSKQNLHKLSYYVPLNSDRESIMQEMQSRLQQKQVRASLVWSIDEPAAVGLLDVLPETASKRQAIEFLMRSFNFDLGNTIFAGDSGNDISVLASPISSVLVANASDVVRSAVREEAESAGTSASLYLAKGGYMDMNGNYSSGILEGVVHYQPDVQAWLDRQDA